MSRSTAQRSPQVKTAKHIRLPNSGPEADELVQAIIEGRADQYKHHEEREAA